MKVAIIGTAPSTFKEAPFDSDWKIWGLAKYAHVYPKTDLLFEIHAKNTTLGKDEDYFTEVYLEFLDNHKVIGWNPRFPYTKITALRALNNKDWHLQSSISYMIAYAVLKGATEIGVWGVDLIDSEEYGEQKAFVEGWLCFAEGRGIKITTPKNSALFHYPYKYGIEKPIQHVDKPKVRSEMTHYMLKVAMQHMQAADTYIDHPDIWNYLKGAGEAFLTSARMIEDTNSGYPVGSGVTINHDKIKRHIQEKELVRQGNQTEATIQEKIS